MTFKNDHKTCLSLKTPNGQGKPCPYIFLNLHELKNKNAKITKNLLRTQRKNLCVISANFASLRLVLKIFANPFQSVQINVQLNNFEWNTDEHGL
jgi:hypothetical protein